MAKFIQDILSYIRIPVLALCLICAMQATALPTSVYADSSRMSQGTWVKITVPSTGVYRITTAKLSEWGFKNPSQVRVFGYGGARISDRLDATTYVDDLPLAPQAFETNGSLVFYAQGPVTWIGPAKDGFYHHQLNPYATVGTYFLSDAYPDLDIKMPVEGLSTSGRDCAKQFTECILREDELTSPGESGHLLVGDDFRFTPKRQYAFTLTDIVSDNSDVELRINFFSRVLSASSRLAITANGNALETASISRTSSSSYGDSCIIRRQAKASGAAFKLDLSFSTSGSVQLANLDKISVNYPRMLRLNGGTLVFRSTESALELSDATSETLVWDVTDLTKPIQIKTEAEGGKLRWVNEYSGLRRYAAWTPGSTTLPSPDFAGRVSNQNIHAEEVPDMVIFTPRAWMSQAERVADIHRAAPDSMRVLVLDQQQVFNEFGSGSGDVNALRRCLKMFYDRGEAKDEAGRSHSLQFAMLMGRPSFDHRRLTQYMKTSGYELVPMWQTDGGSDESTSFGTDDFLAFLEDGSGQEMSNSKMCIAVGRMPVREATAAKTAVDKLENYLYKSPEGDWKNRQMFLADDQDNGVHLDQAEAMVKVLYDLPDGPNFIYNKVYIDAFEKIGGVTEKARERMFKLLGEGTAWWTYIGHASIDSWTGEGMLRRNDIVNNLYYRCFPILYAATCSFQRWDGADDSGSEMMVNNLNGGIIASICPTRPVYISQNGVFTRTIGKYMYARNDKGQYLTVGEIMQRAKNDMGRDSNKLRYVLNGDPAMRVPTPRYNIVLESINGEDITDPEAQPTVKALQRAVFEGYVADPETGKLLDDFNGSLYTTLYDAEVSVVTEGRGTQEDPGKQAIFEEQGPKLYAGRDSIQNGRFKMTVPMPSEISWNFRNAAFNMYAIADDSGREAMGCNRNFYVYGYDDKAAKDTIPPTIDAFFLNAATFKDGDTVNESPMVFATVSDNVGINLSQAGVGHAMLLRLDDTTSYTDVTDYYTPAADGSPSGYITYPLADLTAGHHTLTLRVCDTSSNFAETALTCFVQPGLTPTIFDVMATPNPATTDATFVITHNRPDATLNVKVTVYDLKGRALWSSAQTSRSDMAVSSSITWNLCDRSGTRVPRGIYIYRAEISTDGEHYATAAKRIAVTGD
ncbi:MAG: type IX secretion system sortase PorU [Muribaculaceae bacterium]|nr:type IX secretion system sortase PorU [Muribaculaceae bacterium]